MYTTILALIFNLSINLYIYVISPNWILAYNGIPLIAFYSALLFLVLLLSKRVAYWNIIIFPLCFMLLFNWTSNAANFAFSWDIFSFALVLLLGFIAFILAWTKAESRYAIFILLSSWLAFILFLFSYLTPGYYWIHIIGSSVLLLINLYNSSKLDKRIYLIPAMLYIVMLCIYVFSEFLTNNGLPYLHYSSWKQNTLIIFDKVDNWLIKLNIYFKNLNNTILTYLNKFLAFDFDYNQLQVINDNTAAAQSPKIELVMYLGEGRSNLIGASSANLIPFSSCSNLLNRTSSSNSLNLSSITGRTWVGSHLIRNINSVINRHISFETRVGINSLWSANYCFNIY